MKLNACHKLFGGFLKLFTHESTTLKCSMNFAVYLPPKATKEKIKCPVLYYLSGLTCTEQIPISKSGFQRSASENNLIVVFPDTSPRGIGIAGEDDDWDFGTGAGFYVDATRPPWDENYLMYSYVTKELQDLVNSEFPVDSSRQGITGHSMGGHGAIVLALKNPHIYKSVSAFSPVCNPINCPWGIKAFSNYLGPDKAAWMSYDASELTKNYDGHVFDILIDQGTDDEFLPYQLNPTAIVEAAETNDKVNVTLRMQDGYSHNYYFLQTFIEDHLNHHSKILNA